MFPLAQPGLLVLCGSFNVFIGELAATIIEGVDTQARQSALFLSFIHLFRLEPTFEAGMSLLIKPKLSNSRADFISSTINYYPRP